MIAAIPTSAFVSYTAGFIRRRDIADIRSGVCPARIPEKIGVCQEEIQVSPANRQIGLCNPPHSPYASLWNIARSPGVPAKGEALFSFPVMPYRFPSQHFCLNSAPFQNR